MQKTLLILSLLCSAAIIAQQNKPNAAPKAQALPASVYHVLRDSCTQLDIVFITGKGGSMSLDNKKNVGYFTAFVTTRSVEKKPNAQQDGNLLWQIDGKAFQMANLYFTGDSSAYVTFERNNREYVNALTPDGAGFLRSHGR